MINFFKKKSKKEDPILMEITRQTEELKSMCNSIRKRNESMEAEIQKTENLLLDRGYTQEDLDKIKEKSKFRVI